MTIHQRGTRDLIFISFSQFGSTFSFNFINVFVPFYILRISPYSQQKTLLWIGAITGAASFFSAITSSYWGSLSHRFSPKLLYLRGLLAHSILFFLMGFTTNLYVLLFLRILQGITGGISTIGLIIVTTSSPKEAMTSRLGIFQSSITFGQLVGPPLGTLAAAYLGYRGAFIGASVVLFASFIFCHLYVTDVPKLEGEKKASGSKKILDKRILVGWLLCFTVQIQIMFLPSVLPNVFARFNFEEKAALKLAGFVVMLYTSTAVIGTYVWSWLARKTGAQRMITFLAAAGILFQALLAIGHTLIGFTAIRMAQTSVLAATLPLVISIFAYEPKGGTIGFLNSARFAGNAVGPIMATSILAVSNLTTVHLSIAGITLLAYVGFRVFFK